MRLGVPGGAPRHGRPDSGPSRRQRCFEWFLGRNDLGLPLYDSATGGCRDALHQDHVNQNQGAESTLAFYLSLAEMELAQNIIQTDSVSQA